MRPSVRFDPVARAEFLDALDYLEGQRAGLGRRLARLTHAAVNEIRDHPQRFPVVRGPYRRYRVDPFRYAIVYTVEADGGILVVAYFHLSRNPNRLDERLGG